MCQSYLAISQVLHQPYAVFRNFYLVCDLQQETVQVTKSRALSRTIYYILLFVVGRSMKLLNHFILLYAWQGLAGLEKQT